MSSPAGQDPPHTRPSNQRPPPPDPPTAPQTGNADEFAAFYRRHTKPLVAFLMQQGAHLHDAAAIAQDTMADAWRAWARIERPRAWVYTVAARAWTRQRLKALDATPVDPPPEPPPLLRQTETLELRLDLLRALPLLTERQRQVLTWHLHGHPGPEIAEILGLTEAAVRQHLSQARRTLSAWRGGKDSS